MCEDAWNTLGTLIDEARDHYVNENYDEAIALFRRILDFDVLEYEHRAGVIAELAYCYHDSGEYDLALKLLQTVEELNEKFKDRSGLYRIMGSCHFQLRNYSEALHYRRKAFELSSDPEERKLLLFQIGRSYLFVGDGKAAKKYLKKYLKALSEQEIEDRMDAMYNLGFANMQLGKQMDALKSFNYLVDNARNNEEHARGYYGLTELYYHAGRFDRVIELAQKVLDNDAQFSERETVLFYLIIAFAKEGNQAQVEELAKEFLVEYPNSTHADEVKNKLYGEA